MIWAMSEQSMATVEEYCRRSAADWLLRKEFPFLMLARDGGRHIGNCGIHRFDWERRVFEVGWWCRHAQQGQGYVTEAARALIEFCFKHCGARRVWCFADDANEKSWRVAERAGLIHEGTLRSERADPDGTRRDMRLYAITR
jgi:RimJ/RimL family protein N-acetyltransferase